MFASRSEGRLTQKALHFCPECSFYNNTCILWVARPLFKPKMHPSCMVTSPLQVQKGVINSSVEGTPGQPSSTKGMWEQRISSHPLLDLGFPMIGVEYKSSLLASVWCLHSCSAVSLKQSGICTLLKQGPAVEFTQVLVAIQACTHWIKANVHSVCNVKHFLNRYACESLLFDLCILSVNWCQRVWGKSVGLLWAIWQLVQWRAPILVNRLMHQRPAGAYSPD